MSAPNRPEEVAFTASLVVIRKLTTGVVKERNVTKERLNLLAFDSAKVLYEAFHKLPDYRAYPIAAYAITWELSKHDNQVNLVLPQWYRDLGAKYGHPL